MSDKAKEKIIEDGIIRGIQHFTEFGEYNFENEYVNPINVFGNVMNLDEIRSFRDKLSRFIFNVYKDMSVEEMRVNAVKKILRSEDKKLVEMARDEVIINYVSLEVIEKINDIYSKLRKQSEIILKELEI